MLYYSEFFCALKLFLVIISIGAFFENWAILFCLILNDDTNIDPKFISDFSTCCFLKPSILTIAGFAPRKEGVDDKILLFFIVKLILKILVIKN